MITYTFLLNIKGANTSGKYLLNLQPSQEDYPEQLFTHELRESMRRKLQKDSFCKINDVNLDQMINTWIRDIKEGFRETTMTLNLPSLLVEGINRLQEKGNQDLPAIIPPNLMDIEPQLGSLPPLNFS